MSAAAGPPEDETSGPSSPEVPEVPVVDGGRERPAAVFEEAYRTTRAFEGGKVDDPADPGGRTAFGVTQRRYRAWKSDATADVFAITDEEVRAIYRATWDEAGCEHLERELALVHFDATFQHGLDDSSVFLAQATFAEVPARVAGFAYLALRRRFLRKVVGPRFLRGVLNRVDALVKTIGF